MRLDVQRQRQIVELLLHDPTRSTRAVARQVGGSHNTVRGLLEKVVAAKLDEVRLRDIDDDELGRVLGSGPESRRRKTRPDWNYVRTEREKRDATLEVIWQELRELDPDLICYSSFTDEYRDFRKTISVTMRVERRAGEKLYCDFAGRKVSITDPDTGSVREACVFVSAMGASSKLYAQLVWTQTVADWILCHVGAFAYYGGVPVWTVPDNLKAAVIRRLGAFIEVNSAYRDCLRHYDTATLPARPRKGNDKGSAEFGVRLIQRAILFPWRNRVFFSLESANNELRAAIDRINDKPLRGLVGSRNTRFTEIDLPALKPLPPDPYEPCTWRYGVVVARNYRVEFDHSFYTVPHHLVGQRVDVKGTHNIVQVVHKAKPIASHPRASKPGTDVVDRNHMPVGHVRFLEGERPALLTWSEGVGPGTHQIVRHHLFDRSDPTNGYRAAQAIRELARDYGEKRVEEVSRYCARSKMFALRHFKSTLKTGADRTLKTRVAPAGRRVTAPAHEFNREAAYFGGGIDVQDSSNSCSAAPDEVERHG